MKRLLTNDFLYTFAFPLEESTDRRKVYEKFTYNKARSVVSVKKFK